MLRILHLILQPAAVSFPSRGRLTKNRALAKKTHKLVGTGVLDGPKSNKFHVTKFQRAKQGSWCVEVLYYFNF